MTITNPNALFLVDNYAADDASTVTANEVSGFEATNALAPERWKTWIDPGTFTIESTNKKLYINDGAPKTITLTEGDYEGGAALASHIQTQLNLSSSLWTVTYSSSTYKFTIAHTGSVTLVLSTQTDSVWDDIGFVGAVDEVGTSFVADEQRNHTEVIYDIDLGSPRPISAFVAIAAAGVDFPISSSATAKVQANNSFVWSSPPLDRTLDPTPRGIFDFFDEVTYRYVRFRFSDRLNTVGATGFAISKIWVGPALQLEDHNINVGWRRQLIDPSQVQRSDNGSKWRRRRTKYWRYSGLSIDYLSDDERVDVEAFLARVGQTEAFFVALDPTGLISDDPGEFTKYVSLAADPDLEHFRYTMWMLRLVLEEEV